MIFIVIKKITTRDKVKINAPNKYFRNCFFVIRSIEHKNKTPKSIPINDALEPEFKIVHNETITPEIDDHTKIFEFSSNLI
tara:strand:+ start:1921 stop:2163 length:243 start_codon:yes stop_codon:yes gene_type:complete